MLEVSNVKLPLDAGLSNEKGAALIRNAAAAALGMKADDIRAVRVLRRSVDARKKRDVHFVATLAVQTADTHTEAQALSAAQARGGSGDVPGTRVKLHEPASPLAIPLLGEAFSACGEPRPFVVGSGPAGLFCALSLARAGLRPVVLERGGTVDERLRAVEAFNAGGELDEHTNIQFGEGGAGTFSDGKLTTNIKSPFARHVLQWFVDAGAPEDVLWEAKPHIGTDRLVDVVRTLRAQIEEAGGEFCFHSRLASIHFEGGRVREIGVIDTRPDICSTRFEVPLRLPARRVVLACGHSARDVFCELARCGVHLEQKPFSVGVRIEHVQGAINDAQYGKAASHPALGAADYKLAVHLPGEDGREGRSVYTFCMCPGGEVVCAASEPGGVVVNGMSRYARDGKNANSALLVGVDPADFGSDDPLAGIDLQRRMERAAFEAAQEAGGAPYQAPAQTVGDFLADRAGGPSATVQPTYTRGVAWCNVRHCLPTFVADALTEALPLLNRKLQGFADANAVMTGVETRSSSPVRIVRDETLQALIANEASGGSVFGGCDVTGGTGVYPCGEGAGYAGGIMSAACDGLRVAQAVARAFADEVSTD